MHETQETKFVPSGAVAFFLAMLVLYTVIWITTYLVVVAWR